MKTPKEIHISIQNVAKWEIEALSELIEKEKYLDHRIEEKKIVVFFIKNLEVALWLMYYLESNFWKWNDY